MAESVQIVCPHCNTTNRLPVDRIRQAAKCGRCKQTLFEGKPLELTGSNFRKHLDNTDIPIVVDFWAPWCGPCRMMAPAFVQAAEQLEPRVRLVKLNTEIERTIAAQYGIRSIPTLALFHRGREVARRAGAMGASDIVRWTRAQLGG